jgi:transcription elongation GreA/GreB family factor
MLRQLAVPPVPDKTALRDELARVLEADLEVRERAYRAAREGATHEEARPENDKDTRALEQSYLARGEAQRVEELRAGLAELLAMVLRAFAPGDAVALGAVVVAEDDAGGAVTYWVAPYGGGVKLTGGVQVVTPQSPLGRALIGARQGDVCDVAIGGRTKGLNLVTVR